jgi:hypothetical protein
MTLLRSSLGFVGAVGVMLLSAGEGGPNRLTPRA